VTNSVKNEGAKNRVVTLLIPCCGDTVRYRRGTLPQLRRFENHRRPFDTLRTGTEDRLVITEILTHLGLPTRATPRALERRVDLFQTI
jgi:isochorismate hydrolase